MIIPNVFIVALSNHQSHYRYEVLLTRLSEDAKIKKHVTVASLPWKRHLCQTCTSCEFILTKQGLQLQQRFLMSEISELYKRAKLTLVLPTEKTPLAAKGRADNRCEVKQPEQLKSGQKELKCFTVGIFLEGVALVRGSDPHTDDLWFFLFVCKLSFSQAQEFAGTKPQIRKLPQSEVISPK